MYRLTGLETASALIPERYDPMSLQMKSALVAKDVDFDHGPAER
jgi:hypothetical protein